MNFRNYSGIFIVILSTCVVLSTAARRSRTTTTTEASLELTLAERETALLEREESFRVRESVFRNREEKLSQREDSFKDREEKLSKREKNIELREQNTVRNKVGGSCKEDLPPPDYSVVRYDENMVLQDIGDISPCLDNMRFFASPDNETTGTCDCDYTHCSRPLLYSDKYKHCFWAWSQGPCEQKEWFTYDENLQAVCEPNPCPESPAIGTPSYYFKSPEDGKCYKAGSTGPCAKKGERLFTVPEDPIPKCRKSALCAPQSIPASQQCFPGNLRHFDGLCDGDSSE